jgi:hypothetical protein
VRFVKASPKNQTNFFPTPRNIFQKLCRRISGKNNERKKHMKTMKILTSAAFAVVLLGMSTITANAACVSTAGYWANHAWCVQEISLGGQTYTRDQAIDIIDNSTSGDKTYSLAAQLIGAKLNHDCGGADSTCVAVAIAAADAWLILHPVGSGVTSNSQAWKQVKAAYNTLTDYNEGRLCVPKCRS